MKRAYGKSGYARPYEQYCKEKYPEEAKRIMEKADRYYRELIKDMPDLGKNMMAKNMLDWFTIVAFYEAGDHRIDGEALLAIKRRSVDKIKFIGRFVNGNRQRWPYKVLNRVYVRYRKEYQRHQARGEWMDSWRVDINPEHRTEGFSFHLVGCPIAKHAREHGYETLLPYLCRTDHELAELMHTRLIRTQTEALGGSFCDYWYVGDQSAAAETYRELEKI